MRRFLAEKLGKSHIRIPVDSWRSGNLRVADVRPLRGVRFDRRFTGPVGPLIAPPYDVIDSATRSSNYGIGLIENVKVGNVADQHALSAARYRNWRTRGVLRRDMAPAFYVH